MHTVTLLEKVDVVEWGAWASFRSLFSIVQMIPDQYRVSQNFNDIQFYI